ncbi:MAG TPA: hypothetical protein QF549_03415 [Candidatus Saccharimonadaceae bacterium]|nr:hypothetical protein [Candidatus Saccharimonadaceae bacterium]
MTTYNRTNLKAGIDALELKANQKARADKARSVYGVQIDGGTPHRQAIDNALKSAVAGLKDEKPLLRKARAAAGTSVTSRVKAVKENVNDMLPASSKKPKRSKRERQHKHWSFYEGAYGAFVLTGAVLFVIFAWTLALPWNFEIKEEIGVGWGTSTGFLFFIGLTIIGSQAGRLIINGIRRKHGYVTTDSTQPA